jgi:phosphoribosylanthranilate isomerase
MMRVSRPTQVKICGITNLDDARCAAKAGADFLGFIFYPKSPRYVTSKRAALVSQAIRDEFGAQSPRFVGVFVSESVEQVRTVLETVGLDLAQLHGHETPEEVQALQPHAFKAIRPQTREETEAAITAYRDAFSQDETMPQMLVDAYHPDLYGGTGHQADLDMARSMAQQCRLLLAGGLAPDNVGEAIEQVQPWGVDVSSGVEGAKGFKDHARIQAFIDAVRGVSG